MKPEQNFSTLFMRVYEKGEDLNYVERTVSSKANKDSNSKRGETIDAVVALKAALNRTDRLAFIKVYDPNDSKSQEAKINPVIVHEVETLDDSAQVYIVSSAGNQHLGLREFILIESKYRWSPELKDLSYISFTVEVEPVEAVDLNS